MKPSDYPLALWPAAASASAVSTDYLILAFTVLTLLLVGPIFIGMTFFAFYYREGRQVNRGHREARNVRIELSWMLIPFFLTLIFFVWGARIYDANLNPPPGAMEISAVGRQWMWKFQHPGGQQEINDLHVPVGQSVVINEISQDVIHSLYIPALRVQMETLPDRYTQVWFKANRTGVYRIFCSEFCGTDHPNMDGLLYIMQPADYARWLEQSGSSQTLAAAGKALFSSYGCSGCHDAGSTVHAPSLDGLYGHPVPMEAGGTVVADDQYIHDKILNPNRNLVAGYKQVMPSFKGVISEEDLLRLVAYVKSLGPSPTGVQGSNMP